MTTRVRTEDGSDRAIQTRAVPDDTWLERDTARSTTPERQMCHHLPACPSASAADHDAARLMCAHPEQGWSLLCNGVVLFEDTGEILPDGSTVAPHRPLPRPRSSTHDRVVHVA
jgi:hypothetical protein